MNPKTKETTITILGATWTIQNKNSADDSWLSNTDGYTDFTKRIIVMKSNNDNDLLDFACNYRKQLRHEVIHAFLFESGLGCNFEHPNRFGHDETFVDWFAYQYPKIKAVFKELGIES